MPPFFRVMRNRRLLFLLLAGSSLLGCHCAQASHAKVGSAHSSAHPGTTDRCQESHEAQCPTASELLDCAVEGTDDCLELLENTAREEEGCRQKLAQVLVDEWSLPPTDDRLKKPRLVCMTEPTHEDLEALVPASFDWSVVVASVTVAPGGLAEDVNVIRGSGYEKLNEYVSRLLSEAVYRPARLHDSYIPGTVEMSYRIEPR